MAHIAAAPAEADALRPWAQAIVHAQIPAAMKLLLLALLGALSASGHPGDPQPRPFQGWYPSPQAETDADPDSVLDPRTLRRMRRLDAWYGWILRCDRAEGMALSGRRALTPCPIRTARAPP